MRHLAFLLLFTASSVSANSDYKRLPMCNKIEALPPTAYAIEGCDPPNAIVYCQFGLSDNVSTIIYTVGNQRLLYKEFKYIGDDAKPFGISKKDSFKAITSKLNRVGIKIKKQKNYLKSAPISCGDYSYNLFIRYNKTKSISSISWEIPGSEAHPDD
jgi:hypothetical protein